MALSPGSLPLKEAGAGDWADGACFIPGNKHPLSLPLIPAGRGQFNPFHLCSCRQILCCWQRMGEHLSGFQRGPLPSLTDIGITMGRDAQHRSSKPFQPHSQEHAQGLWQGRVPRAACECTSHGALPLPTIDCQSSTRLHPCQCVRAMPSARQPLCHSWSVTPPRRFHGAHWWGQPGEAILPLGTHPLAPAPAGIIKCAPVEHVLRLATGMWADLTYKPQQPGYNFQTGPIRSVFQLKIY